MTSRHPRTHSHIAACRQCAEATRPKTWPADHNPGMPGTPSTCECSECTKQRSSR